MVIFTDADQCVDEIIHQVGKKIVLATPLGLGKPIQLLNALYRRCKADSTISLTVLTALSLTKPTYNHELEKRLLGPFIDRVYGDYEDILWELDRRQKALPKNVRIVEFFLAAGAYLKNSSVQQDYLSCNYTHVVRTMSSLGVNVFAPMIAVNPNDAQRYSLSSNADLVGDLLETLNHVLVVGQVNKNLPYMFGAQAEMQAERFHAILDSPHGHRKLFSVPKQPLVAREYAIGLLVSSLMEDDGCLQIGIGNLSDAIVFALILRHENNEDYQKLLQRLGVNAQVKPFSKGLFAATEMLLDGYLELYRRGILKKEITDEHGSFVAHAGFFLGSNAFYDALNKMPKEERKRFSMRSVTEINQLYGAESKRRDERKNARFVNSTMMVSLLGEAFSDTLDNGVTVSGVGGQYNFVAMAHELEDAHALIICPSVRESSKGLQSNIVFSRNFATIPRHLRDVVVTEYGIAHLRGKTDQEVIKAMLNIADSRFQNKLLAEAKRNKKIPSDYEIPSIYKNNVPAKIESFGKEFADLLKPFPFGSEFDETEKSLLTTLKKLQKATSWQKATMLFHGFFIRPKPEELTLLARMDLAKTRSMKEIVYRNLVLSALRTRS